jgi:uncharacterized protein (TIGR03437 family)
MAPPTILSIARASGAPLNATNPAVSGDLLNVVISGLDPTAAGNAGRVSVTVGGAAMSIQQIVPQGAGVYLIEVQLTNPPTGDQVPLAVWVDGSCGWSLVIPVATPAQ